MKYYFFFVVVLVLFFVIFNNYTKGNIYENFYTRTPWTGFHPFNYPGQ